MQGAARKGQQNAMTDTTTPAPEAISFDTWWQRFLHCAEEAGFEINADDSTAYREYYDDGDTPEEALEAEIEISGGEDGDF